MQKVIITADSSCDMPSVVREKYDVPILPFYINIGDETFRDGVDIDRDTLYKKVEETGILPQTAAIAPGVFADFFAEQKEKAEAVVHFSVGAKLSSAYQSAMLAASEMENVFVVDTKNLSSAETLTILHGLELAEKGCDGETIAKECRDFAEKCDASFVLDTLDYMKKGGRCSAAAALGANLLGIKPSLAMYDGKLELDKKYRGKLKMVLPKYIHERIEAVTPDTKRIIIANSGVDADVLEAAVNAVSSLGIFEEILLSEAGCVISSHCGPGTLGILFVTK